MEVNTARKAHPNYAAGTCDMLSLNQTMEANYLFFIILNPSSFFFHSFFHSIKRGEEWGGKLLDKATQYMVYSALLRKPLYTRWSCGKAKQRHAAKWQNALVGVRARSLFSYFLYQLSGAKQRYDLSPLKETWLQFRVRIEVVYIRNLRVRFAESLDSVVLTMVPIFLIFFFFSRPFLQIWLQRLFSFKMHRRGQNIEWTERES